MTERHISTTIVADDLDADEAALDADASRPMRADARRNEERLVAAARHVFNQQGGEASMDAIAKEAGVGIGTLYRHFPKRIDVVEAVYKTDVDGLVATADEVDNTMEPWAAMVSWLEGFVDYASTKRNFLTELHEAFEKAPELRVASRERIVGALEHRARPGPSRRCRAPGSRRSRSHAAARVHVHERHPHRGPERATARPDPRRPSAAAAAIVSSEHCLAFRHDKALKVRIRPSTLRWAEDECFHGQGADQPNALVAAERALSPAMSASAKVCIDPMAGSSPFKAAGRSAAAASSAAISALRFAETYAPKS